MRSEVQLQWSYGKWWLTTTTRAVFEVQFRKTETSDPNNTGDYLYKTIARSQGSASLDSRGQPMVYGYLFKCFLSESKKTSKLM